MLKEGWKGRYYEDFEIGDVYRHPLGRTITDTDNIQTGEEDINFFVTVKWTAGGQTHTKTSDPMIINKPPT